MAERGFARTDDAAGAPPAPFEYQQDPFTRSSEYPYNVCNQLPGNIGEDAASYAETYKRAKCVPIEAGELEFCDAVAYDSCVRIQEYWRFDNLVAMQYDAVLQEWKDTLTANDQAALVDPGCDAAFKAYFCYAAFPKCWEGDIEGEYWELPLCFDYCVAANAACIGNPEAAKRVCRSQVGTGRVSPEGRTDIICMSCASGLVAKLRAHALLAALFAAAASAMLPP
eukprot:PRCOL_00004132-RA